MNILITSHDPTPQYIYGDKRVSITLAKEWKRHGHNVFILSFCPYTNLAKEVEGVEQLLLPDHQCVCSNENISFFKETIKNRNVHIVLHQHARIEMFNKLCFSLNTNVILVTVIHFDIAHDEKVLSQWFFSNIRNGADVYKWIKDCLSYLRYLLYRKKDLHTRLVKLYADIYSHSDIVSLLSSNYSGLFKEYVPNVDDNKLLYINNPIIPITTKLYEQKEKIVLWVGRLGYDMKRLDYMLNIWKEINKTHSDWQLKILGSGDWDYWKKIIVRYNIENAEVVGFCNTSEYYQKASIICMTSVTEGLPMVLIEAQQYGCVPIAYSSFAALDDIINDGENGYSVKAFDQKEYVSKLRRLMDNSNIRDRMSVNAIESVKRFNVDNIAALWIDNFERILEQ